MKRTSLMTQAMKMPSVLDTAKRHGKRKKMGSLAEMAKGYSLVARAKKAKIRKVWM